jgi:hypothetical protein
MRREHVQNMSLNEDLLGFNNTLTTTTNQGITSRTNLSTLRSFGNYKIILLILESFPTFATEPDQHQHHIQEKRLNPITTFGMKAYTFNTSHGKIEIKEDGWIVLEITRSKRTVSISPNGQKVLCIKLYLWLDCRGQVPTIQTRKGL